MSETGSALRATSDALLADLEALEALEQEKRNLEPGDPRIVELAAAVEDVARRLLGQTVRQRELTAVIEHQVQQGAPDAPDQPIADTPREIHLILADWRAAERRSRDAKPGSVEAQEADADLERFREEYRAAHDAARSRP